jgi:predicted patatin/cPLA2 family phospholipase
MPITRSLSPDTLAPRMAMVADQRGHPVIQTLLRRREEGSRPGARTDGRRVALVIEGGAMRGVVSAGMASALDQLGLRDAFDEVHGASAGAFNGAFFMAGQAAYLTSLYWRGFGDPRFVSLRRALRGEGPAFDMDYVIDGIWARGRPLRIDVLLESAIELHCTATDADTAAIVDLADLRSTEEVRCALRASARLPWLAGQPVAFRGRRLLDATLAEAIPVQAALKTATDVLVLQTRPEGVEHSGLSGPVGLLTDRYLRTINPGLVALRRTRSERYDELSAWLGRRAAESAAAAQAGQASRVGQAGQAGQPAICVIRPPAEATAISQLEYRNEALQVAGSEGLRSAWMAVEGEDPEVLDVLRAYSRGPTGDPGTHTPHPSQCGLTVPAEPGPAIADAHRNPSRTPNL